MLGDSLLKLAILLYVFDATGSTAATTAAFVAEWAPRALLGITGGVLADRIRAKRLLIGSDVMRAVVLLPLLLAGGELWVILCVLTILASVSTVAEPAFQAAVPGTVPREQLPRANSLSAAIVAAMGLIGLPAGAALYGLWGFRFVVLLDVATFLVSLAMLVLVRLADRRAAGEARPSGIRAETLEGLRYLRSNATCRALLAVGVMGGVVEGLASPVYVPYLRGILHASTAQISAINVADGLAILLVSLLCGSVAVRLGLGRTLCTGLILAGVALAVAGIAPNIWVGATGLVLIGAGSALISPMLRTIVQVAVAPGYLGRAFGAMGTAFAVVGVTASAIPAAVGGTIGVRILLMAGAAVACASLVPAARRLWGFRAPASDEPLEKAGHVHPDPGTAPIRTDWTAVG